MTDQRPLPENPPTPLAPDDEPEEAENDVVEEPPEDDPSTAPEVPSA